MFFIQLFLIFSRSKAEASATPILIFGGSATAVSAFKVSAKNGLFLGKMTGRHFSGLWREHLKRPKNKPFFAVKNFSSERHFTKYVLYFALRAILQMFKMVPDHFVWILFFAVDHIYGINMEQLQLA